MRVLLVSGSRDWSRMQPIRDVFDELEPELVLHGAARGLDVRAAVEARCRGIPDRGFPAAWDLYGRRAGTLRNEEMLSALVEYQAEGHEVMFAAFPMALSVGTRHMIRCVETYPWSTAPRTVIVEG